ncbi:FKBP-type peptidyl-prolyl cis-trans isomerase-59 [Wuchereria bancrofti]|uniref:peptidylprolyl isomerase n=1 Tax=Wuchereria bancrofti TaxID=6293 RepID=J9EIK4_WUCBA|nr:FKBP-type peptidyl-prolyl cis-trans isomerase-59 [Wuchereria bancrofti]
MHGTLQVIKGWDLGVATMKKGEKCDLICRADYAYGENGSPPKIPGGATLKFEIELLSWQGEDISPDRDGTITRSIIVEGEKYSSPTEGSTVKVCAVGSYNGQVFYDKEVSFILGEGSEVGLPEGVDRALRRFNKGEKSIIHLKGNRFTFGATPPSEYGLPPHAEIDFTLFLKEYEKIKASWELTGEEKLNAAEAAKERGTMFFKQGKMRLAAAKYMRVIELLEYEKSLENEAKSKRDALLLAGYLNSALVYAKQDETVECIKNCDKALEVDPKCVKALYRKALALQEQNDADEAIIEYKKVLEYEPDNKAAVAQIVACKKKLAEIREKEKKRYKGMFERFAAKEKVETNEDLETTPMGTASPKSEVVN